MARILRSGELSTILRSSGGKLVAVDFSNPGCPPCRAIKPWWDKLPQQYKSVVFCTIMCQDCPDDAQSNGITATPTFVFFQKGHEVARILGPDKMKITSTLEKYKTPETMFTGKSRAVGSSSTTPASPTTPPSSSPQQSNSIRTNQHDNFTQMMLLEMGFPLSKVTAALNATHNGTVDDCVLFLEKLQNHETDQNAKTTQELLSMGFKPEHVNAAIQLVGPNSIENCIEAIQAMTDDGDNNKQSNTAEKTAQLKARLAEKKKQEEANASSKQAKEELQRRKDCQDTLAIREQVKSQQADYELKQLNKQKQDDILAKRQALERIRNQRQENNSNSNITPKVQRSSSQPQSTERRECTLKMIFPDGSNFINKFQSTDTLHEVISYINQNVPDSAKKNIGIETTFPARVITKESFDMTLAECQFVPRAQVNIQYL